MELEELSVSFTKPAKTSQEERAETTQRENTRLGYGGYSGGEIGQGIPAIDLHQTPRARAVLLPKIIKTGARIGWAIQQKTSSLTRGKT